MRDILIQRQGVNTEALTDALKAAFPGKVFGVSTGPYGVRVHVEDSTTSENETNITSAVQTHDPAVLTTNQQAVVDVRSEADTLRAQAAQAIADIDAALAALPAATLTETKTIIGGILQRQKRIIKVVARLSLQL